MNGHDSDHDGSEAQTDGAEGAMDDGAETNGDGSGGSPDTAVDRRQFLSAAGTALAAGAFATPAAADHDVEALISDMTLDEKTSLTYGVNDGAPGIGHVQGIPRLDIPDVYITDGPLGVIGAANPAEDYNATAFPANLGVAATFDPALATQEGDAIAREVKDSGNHQLFAPAMNIGRYPGCGRLFDYYSGDPHLSGEMGANFVQGVQSQGVVATPKHFVANNQDFNRKDRNEVIPERALREIYLSGFKTALLDGGAGSVMGAYNRVNGTFCTENGFLLQDVLRDEWGWDGYVCSDYCAVHSTVDAANNGLDVSTGCAEQYFGSNLAAAVNNGQVAEAAVDEKVRRFLTQFQETGHLDGNLQGDPPVANQPWQQDLSRQIAEEGSVLLKNDGVLPLDAGSIDDLAVLGHQNGEALVSDSLSSDVDPPYEVAPSDAIWDRASGSTNIHYNDVSAAQDADVAIVYAGEEVSEGVDRSNIDLPAGQNSMISDVASQNPNTVVVLRSPGPVEMPWIDDVAAVLEMWYPGMEDGNAAVNVLFGDTDPGGKLPITFGQQFEDYPAHQNPEYPGVDDGTGTLHAEYNEGIFVDYRWFDEQGIVPLFPFGHGLSYTSFSYGNVQAPASATFDGGVQVSVDVTNTGDRAGSEVVQLYVEDLSASVARPPKELAAFQKVHLGAGETTTVTLSLARDDFAFWDPGASSWVAENGQFRLHVGSSSRDVRGTATVDMSGGTDEGDGGGGGGGDPEQSPYDGPHVLPGRVQAQHFDEGGQDVAYNDTTDANQGGDFRTGEAVDVETTGDADGQYNVGWIEAGEWLEYTVEVESDGTYDLDLRVASASGGGSATVLVDGATAGSASFDATGGWQSWTTVSAGSVDLAAGEHVVRIAADSGGWNVNWFEVSDSGDGSGGVVAGQTYQVTNVNSGKALDVSGVSTADGADVHQWAYAGGDNQHWTVEETTDGYYQLVAAHSGKVLDVADASTADGANVQQWADFDNDNQTVAITEVSAGTYRIDAVHSGKPIEVADASTADGATVQQWSWTGADNQLWQFEQV